MSVGQLDQVTQELSGFRDDLDARRDILERASLSLLHRPALGGQLVARFCAAAEDDPTLEDLSDLLGSALFAARMARENRKTRGDTFISAAEEAVALAARRGTLTTFHRLLLAQIWARNGLAAPKALELTEDDIEASDQIELPPDRAMLDAMLDDLFDDLLRQAEGDALGVHAALAETFPAMPAVLREQVVEFSVTRPDVIYTQLGCFWLVDPSPAIRRAAAAGLSTRLAKGLLTAETTAKLTVLRSWVPEDEAREHVDQLLRDAMRLGASPADSAAPWTVHSVLATLPDGGGAQSFGIALQSGKSRSVAMVLAKQGHGVKDAYVVPCRSAGDQKTLMKHLASETGAQPVPLGYLADALSMALGDGLAQGLPPAPGLIDVVALCGLTDLRPRSVDTERLLAGLAAHEQVTAFSPQKRGRLINASADWWDRHEIVRSWFEESDSVHELMDQPRSQRAMESALWKWLETRRGWWAHLIARGAAMLEAAGVPDADSFTATAMALLEGRDLKKIPVMADVHEQTIEAWIFDDPDIEPDTSLEDLAAMADAVPEPPKPERKDELAKLLKGAAISVEWIDGYLMSVVIAPKMIAPNRWLPILLDGAIAGLDPISLQRFLDIVMIRANDAIALAEDGGVFERRMGTLADLETQDWAAGFTTGCESFRASWPAKSTGPNDRAMQRMVSDGAGGGLGGSELHTLGQWIAARHRRNQTAP